MTAPTQPPLVAGLMEASAYPHPVEPIRIVETHISWVFLTGTYAYKVKKPVDLGFADFSTLERRAHFCRRELELNRRLAPGLYLDVLPIVGTEQEPRIGGPDDEDQAIEWCVRMRQFDERDLLVHRLEQGDFDPAWLDTLAVDVARFHEQAAHGDELQAYGAPSVLASHVLANLDVAEAHAAHLGGIEPLRAHRARLEDELARLKPRLIERQQRHRIRDCHGDLHLRNITLLEGRPTAFDCIEFNDEFRIIDTMNDVAFLMMDLWFRERPDLAMRFLSRYLEEGRDHAGLGLARLFMAYRAGVRGKVACLLGEDLERRGASAEAMWREGAAYFRLADRLLDAPSPRLWVVGGLSGAGKSVLALQGAGREQAVVIRSDATRKRLHREHPDLPLYSQEMSRITYRTMFEDAKAAIEAGFPVILDATFLSGAWRDEARGLAAGLNVPLTMLWLDVPEEELRRRVAERSRKRDDVSDADLAVLESQLENYERPTEPDIRFWSDSLRWPDE